jgi:hypothetical protein
MKNILYISLVCASSLLLSGCMDSEDELKAELLANVDSGEGAQVSAGSANFSKFVSVGNSITAGLMDAALYNAGQARSYPKLISEQMLLAGGGAFNQPDINSQDGYNISVAQPGTVVVGRFVLDVSIPGPVPLLTGDVPTAYAGNKSALNNFGVPGARVVDLLSPAYAANPLYARFASAPGTSTILGDAAAANGTFISIWIGQNDLLGYLTSGGTSEDVADNPAAILNPRSLTDVPNFTGALAAVAGTLSAGGSKGGVITNLLDATFTPFFRAVPNNAIPLSQGFVDQLNASFGGFNAALNGLAALDPSFSQADADERKVFYQVGQNAILIEDDNLVDISAKLASISPLLAPYGQTRQMKASANPLKHELVLLSAAPVLNTSPAGAPPTVLYGISWPLPDKYTLTSDELTLHATRLAQFNAAIAAQASASNLALVDAYTLFISTAIGGGIVIDGVKLKPDFSPNGIFSTDGIHPNARGQAIIANKLIDAINAKYGSTLNQVDVLNLPGINLL